MKSVQIVVALAATVFGGFLFYVVKRRRSKQDYPLEDDWQYVGTLEEIIMYPIKSCDGVRLEEARCEKNGLTFAGVRDRQMFLYDHEDRPLFAGAYPRMWNIQSRLMATGEIQVHASGMEPLLLNIEDMTHGRKEVVKRFGKSFIRLIECDAHYGRWFSKFLLGRDTGLRLFVCVNFRTIRFRKNMNSNPYMALVMGSIDDLNNRLSNKVHNLQFRGNFLINNTRLPAYSEDNWKWMRIGNEAVFRYKAPCYRCILPNINPFTCERSKDFEPLRTLKKYRMKPGQKEPEMGIYFNLHNEGAIKLGDEVFVVI